MKFSACILFFVLVLTPAASAEVIYVPAERPTIQDGIDTAMDGDIVRVVDGVYSGPGNIDLDFKGKAIIVESGNGPQYTVIDPQFLGRAVRFHDGEGRDSVLRGFTIRQGFGSSGGGAILVERGCSPTIADNIIVDCRCTSQGGAIHCQAETMPLITGNAIARNRAVKGGGISLFNCDPVITDNKIQNNEAGSDGGGIAMRLCRLDGVNNLFDRNSAGADGGAIHCVDSRLTLRCTTFVENDAGAAGGGICSLHSHVTISDTIMVNDTAGLGQGPEVHNGGTGFPSHLIISYSNVRGGPTTVVSAEGSTLARGEGVIFETPGFINGVYGDFYLRNILAGQSWTSASVDAGSEPAVNVSFPGAGGEVLMSQLTTRVDDWPDDGTLDLGFHYPPYVRDWKTVETSITCIPSSGTLPLNTQMWVRVHNISPESVTRQYAVKINLLKRNGQVIRNWRAGFTNLGTEFYYWDAWNTTIPAVGPMMGNLTFIMVAEDVTTPPYNFPPYPPAGSTDTHTVTVTTFAP